MALPVPVLASFATSTDGSSVTSTTLTAPSGISAGDLLVVLGLCNANNSEPDMDISESGWTKIDEIGNTVTDAHIALFWKKATGSETDVTLTYVTTASRMMGFYLRITGADTTDPFDDWGNQTDTLKNTQLLIHTSGDVVTTEDNTLALACGAVDFGESGYDSSDGTLPSGWTEVDQDITGTTSSHMRGMLFQRNYSSPTSIGYIASTITQANYGSGFTLAIKPGVSATRRIFIT